MNIAIDIDEVLSETTQSIIDYHNERFGTNLKLTDFTGQKFWQIWGGTRQEAIDKVRDFYKTDYFQDLPVVAGAKAAIAKLKEDHELHVVTGRPFHIQNETHEWIHKHFPNTFKDIHMANHYAMSGESRLKSEICNEHGIEAIVEDSYEYAMDCVSAERKVYLMKYPWNQHQALVPNIHHVDSWEDIMNHFEK